MADIVDKVHLERLLEQHYQNICIFEEEAAQYGISPPLHITNQLKYERQKAAETEEKLKAYRDPLMTSKDDQLKATIIPTPTSPPTSALTFNTKPVYDPEKISFTDRAEILDKLKESSATQYVLIDAPLGYGKTSLLEEIVRHFPVHEGWLCAFVPIDRQQLTMPIQIMHSIGLQVRGYSQPSIETEQEYFVQVNKAIQSAKKGVVLLFDGIDYLANVAPETEQWLLEYVLRMFENLKDLEFSHNLKIVFAGRNIKKRWTSKKISMLDIPQLKPFDEKVVTKAVCETLEQVELHLSPEKIHAISRLILRHSGGHPQIITHILLKLRRDEFVNWREYLDDNKGQIYHEFTEKFIDDVTTYIPDNLRHIFEVLSVFRQFDTDTLSFLIDQGAIPHHPEFGNGRRLVRMIEDTRIREWNDNGFYASDIVRRLLVLKLRRDREWFLHLCDLAELFYRNKASSPDDRLRHMWVIEAAYQQLLRYTVIGDQPQKAQIIKDIVATLYLDLEYTHPDARAGRLDHLEKFLNGDKEWLYLASDVLGSDAGHTILSQLQQRANAELGDLL